MRVFFVRHGQSMDNLLKRASGWSRAPLSDLGRQQAASVVPILQGIRFDKVFSSDLLRARQTAHEVLPDYEPVLSDKIREINVGSISGTLRTELTEKYGEIYTNAVINHDYTRFGGENDDMVHARVSAFMKELEKLEGCENVAVFGHEGTAHAMVSYVLNARFDLKCLRTPNCSVTVFSFEDGRWKLEKFGYSQTIVPQVVTYTG